MPCSLFFSFRKLMNKAKTERNLFHPAYKQQKGLKIKNVTDSKTELCNVEID